MLTAAATMLATFPNLGLTWDDLDWLREQTSLPLLVKGVLRGRRRAARASSTASTAIIVSNHGGRQVDGAIAALDALVEVRDALGPRRSVLDRRRDPPRRRRREGDGARRRHGLLGRLYAYGPRGRRRGRRRSG